MEDPVTHRESRDYALWLGLSERRITSGCVCPPR